MHTNTQLWLEAFLYLLSLNLHSPCSRDSPQDPSFPAR